MTKAVKETHTASAPQPTPAPAAAAPPSQETISEADRMSLELAKANRKTALAQAEKALAENQLAEMNYKYIILQLYMKYGLNETDALSEDGKILRGGAIAQQAN